MSKYGVFSVPYFPVFRLNMDIFGVNLRIQSKNRKIRTRKNYVFGHFSRNDILEHFDTMTSFLYRYMGSNKKTFQKPLAPASCRLLNFYPVPYNEKIRLKYFLRHCRLMLRHVQLSLP